jgi:hypothetical protein
MPVMEDNPVYRPESRRLRFHRTAIESAEPAVNATGLCNLPLAATPLQSICTFQNRLRLNNDGQNGANRPSWGALESQ